MTIADLKTRLAQRVHLSKHWCFHWNRKQAEGFSSSEKYTYILPVAWALAFFSAFCTWKVYVHICIITMCVHTNGQNNDITVTVPGCHCAVATTADFNCPFINWTVSGSTFYKSSRSKVLGFKFSTDLEISAKMVLENSWETESYSLERNSTITTKKMV